MKVIYVSAVLLFYQTNGIELKREFGENVPEWKPKPVSGSFDSFGREMGSTSFMSVNHYFCEVDEIEDPVMIMYGTKSWTFPTQDVNLTLSYPTAEHKEADRFEAESESLDAGYIISKFKVILYIDGMDCKGFIMQGGVMKDSIVLSFVCRSISSLSYQFWLHGVPKDSFGLHNDIRNFACS